MVNNKELKELFNGIKNKDEKSFKQLYEKYHQLVYGIAFSICKNHSDSEDILQNVFAKIYSLESNKLPLNNEETWLYKVTKNETIACLRKKNNTVNIDEIYELQNDNNDIDNVIDQNTFKKLISGLNEKEKEIMSLKVLGNFSFDEIGKIINEPVGTIKWRYYKSINSLKLCLSSLAMSIVSFIFGTKLLKQDLSSKEKTYIKEDISSNKGIDSTTKEALNFDSMDSFSSLEPASVTSSDSLHNNYCGPMILFGISSIFLISTINIAIFFKKYQLKTKKKSSKY